MNCNIRKKLSYILILSLLLITITGCSDKTEDDSSENESNKTEVSTDTDAAIPTSSEMFTESDLYKTYDDENSYHITLSDSAIDADNDSILIDNKIVTIKNKGTYIISGDITNGQIIIDAGEEKVQIVLKNTKMTNGSLAPIYVKSADKVFVTLADGSNNSLSVSGEFEPDEETNIDGVIFAKDDLVLNGSGSLTITSTYGHGIVSKDDLKITAGSYNLTASEHALSANDSIRLTNASIEIDSGEDGIHTSGNDEDEQLGYIYIESGNIIISSGDDGIHAEAALDIEGGNINILKSYEGLEGRSITINDGNISLVATDDGLNSSTGSSSSETSTFPANMQGNMQRPDNANTPADMQGNMQRPDNANMPADMQGNMQRPDNANMPADMQGNMQRPDNMHGMDVYNQDNFICINGGIVNILANGDGIDSNGDLCISGGTIYVSGPSNDGNGALDYAGEAVITGGTIIATGSSGMAQNFSDNSSQGCILYMLDEYHSESIVISDSEGNEILSFGPENMYNCINFSSPEIVSGNTYTITVGDEKYSVSMDSLIFQNISNFNRR